MTADDVALTETTGYQNIVPVDREKMRDLGVSKEICGQFASAQNIAQLNIIEFFHAVPYYPIVFIKQLNGDYTPNAVLGLQTGRNLFTDRTGDWHQGIYSPAYIRRYPFITESVTHDDLEIKQDVLRKPVFVDETALVKDAPSLFIANGVATAEWEVIESFVSDYISAERLTLAFTQKLDELKLLEPFDAQVHPDRGDMLRLKGMYRVNEDRLNNLPAATVKQLMQTGELSRVYAHLISLENFARLLDRDAVNRQE